MQIYPARFSATIELSFANLRVLFLVVLVGRDRRARRFVGERAARRSAPTHITERVAETVTTRIPSTFLRDWSLLAFGEVRKVL